jgi:transposase
MSVYVGIDVHRKRSQVAVIDQSGGGARQPQRAQRGGADLEGDRRAAAGDAGGVRGRVRHGVASGAARGLRVRPAPGAPAAVQGDRFGAVEERQGPAPRFWRSCCARTCRRRRGSRRPRCASCGRCCGTGSSWVRLRTLLRNRIHAVLAGHGYGRPAGCRSGPSRDWLASLPLPAASREVAGDGLALIDATEARTGRLDGEIRQRARSDPRVKVLTQLPGAGAVHRAGHPG